MGLCRRRAQGSVQLANSAMQPAAPAVNASDAFIGKARQGALKVVTERVQNADFHRKPQIFADSPLLLETQDLESAGNRREPQSFAEDQRLSKKTTGSCRLGSVTLGPSPLARP